MPAREIVDGTADHSARRARLRWAVAPDRWRGVPRDLRYLLVGLPRALADLLACLPLLTVGVPLLLLGVGLPAVTAALRQSRSSADAELERVGVARPPRLVLPPAEERPVGDARAWLTALYTVLVGPVLHVLTWTAALVVTVGAVQWSTQWLWKPLTAHRSLAALETWRDGAALLVGLGLLLLAPVVLPRLVDLHAAVDRCVLAQRSVAGIERLRVEARVAEASREAAVRAEDTTLRQLERDIHDGPQQSLLRLQFDLSSVHRRVSGIADAEARELLEGAMTLARVTLEELRSLSRGLAPPLLQDLGLVAALEPLAARTTVPVTVRIGDGLVGADLRGVERSAYFVACELLANVAKHSSASRAVLDVTLQGGSGTGLLVLAVSDDGAGGARVLAGHGLDQMRERVSGLRGEMELTSPPGGPTTVTVRLPVSAATRAGSGRGG